MKYFTSLILAASVASAAPARRQASNDVRILINVDKNTESRTNNIPIGQLVQAGGAGVPDEIFALRIQEDIGATCTFNYIFEGQDRRRAQLSFGNDFETAAPSGQVEWVDLLCQVGGAAPQQGQNNNRNGDQNNRNNQGDGNGKTLIGEMGNGQDAGGQFRLQIDRDSNGEAIQRQFTAGQTISANDNPFSADTDVFALRLLQGNGLSCTFKYRFEQREDRTATFTVGDDFITQAPSGVVEFQSLLCQ